MRLFMLRESAEDMTMTDKKVTPSILTALMECKKWLPGNYVWKRKTMQKAVALGLAEEIPPRSNLVRMSAFVLTAAGHAVLSERTDT